MENEVQGFQFEPLKKRISRSTNSDSDSSWETCDDSDGDTNLGTRLDEKVDSWCKCGNCVTMPTEQECLCCHELDSAKNIFDLQGTQIIFLYNFRPS